MDLLEIDSSDSDASDDVAKDLGVPVFSEPAPYPSAVYKGLKMEIKKSILNFYILSEFFFGSRTLKLLSVMFSPIQIKEINGICKKHFFHNTLEVPFKNLILKFITGATKYIFTLNRNLNVFWVTYLTGSGFLTDFAAITKCDFFN